MNKTFALALALFFFLPAFSQEIFHPELGPLLDERLMPFCFGVASGDPRSDGVVIWTKILPVSSSEQVVFWEIDKDSTMQHPVQSGTEAAIADRAFTVKIQVQNLDPATYYYYRFRHGDKYSEVGRTKTAPKEGIGQLRFAVVSCADFQMGQYNAYGHIAARNDLDAVIHLGDYIYEYPAGKWGPKRTRKRITRTHIPAHVCKTLQDYRTRYAQYRTDAQLRECHRRHPFITIWDDHEISNNVHSGLSGQQWEERETAARQAYFEWLPIQDNDEQSIIRQFAFGDLAEMWMLDGRLEGRSPQAKGTDDPDLYSPDRKMLGDQQTDWLLNGMAQSPARWKIMGNQVIFSPMHDSKVFDRRPDIRMDRWDGYPAEQQRIFDFFYKNNLQNILVITGDVHTAWAIELTDDPLDKNVYDRKSGKGVIGAEFVSPSVSSFNLDEIAPRIVAGEGKRRLKLKKHNPHLRFVDLVRHGYFTLSLTPEQARADWYFMKRMDVVDTKIGKKTGWAIDNNGRKLYKVD